MYRIVLSCDGVPAANGPEAAVDITNEFSHHRQWHQNVTCVFEAGRLTLTGENDVDSDGLALLDEFRDCVFAYLADFEEIAFSIESVTKLGGE